MKITLILAAAPDDPLRRNDPFMPLSLPLLAASAPGHDYTFVDMLAGEEPDLDAKVDVVGISARLTAERAAYRIAERYRLRGAKVVLGGPQISSVPLRAAEHADAVVVGEGEPLWPIVLDDIASGVPKKFYVSIPGPFDAQGQTVHRLESHPDLSGICDSTWARKLFRKRYVFDTVFSARGCPMDCDFCSVTHLQGKQTRLRPVEDVVREISSFKSFYYLLDDTVFGRPSTYDHYFRLYDAISHMDKVRLWTGQANLDAASTPEGREVIRSASRAGLVYAAIGMESINPAVLRKNGALAKSGAGGADDVVSRMKEHIRFIQDQGILVSGWFTMGYEEDTLEDFGRTLDFCRETRIIPVLCPLEALPGTRLHARLSAEGRVSATRKINVVHPKLTDEQILHALDEASRRGFTLLEIASRTLWQAKRFGTLDARTGDRVRAKIEKSFFAFNLQVHLRKGIIGLANMERD